MATFNGTDLTITLAAPTNGALEVRIQRIYSEWKEWQVANFQNMGYPPAFRTVGGDPLAGSINAGSYYFLDNHAGWRIISTDEDQTVFIDGNLVPEDSTLPVVEGRPGRTITYVGLQPVTQNVEDLRDDQMRILRAVAYRQYTNAATGNLDIYDDADALDQSVPIFEDDGVTPWDGTGGILRRDKIV